MFRRLYAILALSACLLAVGALMAPVALAKPKPPSCPTCPSTITVGGITCTLSACGFDCVYTCPFPR
jgi:hypothetical protein